MTKIGVISDTHMPGRAVGLPQKMLDDFKTADMVIHVGDLVELAVLRQLESCCKNVTAVWGNMDGPEVREKLQEKKIIKIGKYKIGIMHGAGHPGKLVELLSRQFKDDAVDVIIFGHSHLPLNERKGGILFFNPGSPTDKIFSPFNSYGIIEIDDDKIEAKIIEI